VKNWESPYIKKDQIDKNGVTYKLTIKKITNGFLSHLGRKNVLGLTHPYIHAQQHHQAASCCYNCNNKTTRALDLLAKQSTKMHNAIYQNCLALDYLLTSEGGVCKKFNLNNCCLQIDD
jgi:hypothetical protein